MRFPLNIPILLAAIILFAFGGCDRENQTRIDENEFWRIVQKAKADDGDEAHARRLHVTLKAYPAGEILNFYRLYMRYHDNAYEEKVWAAGMLLNGGHGSDDGFEYFRNWLISRGQQVYDVTLTDPDALASEFVPYVDGYPSAEFESYRYIIYDVYQDKTGRELFDDLKEDVATPRADKPVTDWQEYDSDEKLSRKLPKLWAKYGAVKQAFDRRVEKMVEIYSKGVNEVAVDGLGKIRLGDILIHSSYGKGEVVYLRSHTTAEIPGQYESKQIVLGKLKFGDEIHPMMISTEHFKKP